MADIIASEQINGDEYNNSLRGGSGGIDFLKSRNGSYSPLENQEENRGFKQIFLRHNGVESIEDLHLFITTFDGTYQGSSTAEADIERLAALGAASNSETANNTDGRYSGLAFDMQRSPDDQIFSPTRIDSTVFIPGRAGRGLDISGAFPLLASSVGVNNDGTLSNPSNAQDGILGPIGSQDLGDTIDLKARFYFPKEGQRNGGVLQFNLSLIYSETG